MPKHTTSRSHVAREAHGLSMALEQLWKALGNTDVSRTSNSQPIIETSPLHGSITKLDDHLGQLKTLTNYKAKP